MSSFLNLCTASNPIVAKSWHHNLCHQIAITTTIHLVHIGYDALAASQLHVVHTTAKVNEASKCTLFYSILLGSNHSFSSYDKTINQR